MHQTNPAQKQPNPTQKHTNPTNLTLKLVTGDTHSVHSDDYETVINSVGDLSISMIAFHAGGRRDIPCRAIVSMVEAVPSDTQGAATWTVDR